MLRFQIGSLEFSLYWGSECGLGPLSFHVMRVMRDPGWSRSALILDIDLVKDPQVWSDDMDGGAKQLLYLFSCNARKYDRPMPRFWRIHLLWGRVVFFVWDRFRNSRVQMLRDIEREEK